MRRSGRQEAGAGSAAARAAEARDTCSSCTSWGVRPMEMLAAPSAPDHDRHTNYSATKCQRRSEIANRQVRISIPERVESASRSRGRQPIGSLRPHADVASCSCAPCATTRPTPRSTATGCCCGPGYIRRVAAGIYAWLPLGHRVLRQGRADRARGDGRGRRAGGAAPDPPAARAVAAHRPRRGVRPADVPPRGPQGDRVLPLADRRGGRSRRSSRGEYSSVPRPAGEPLPDQLEVPRRAAAPLRAPARRASS